MGSTFTKSTSLDGCETRLERSHFQVFDGESLVSLFLPWKRDGL